MKHKVWSVPFLGALVLLSADVMLSTPAAVAAPAASGAVVSEPETPAAPAPPNYSSLADLVIMVGDEAIGQFDRFFQPEPVAIEPFVTIDEQLGRHSLLGLILADQMAAVINNNAKGRPTSASRRNGTEQSLTGVLQEMDGYLRVQMSGLNARGERRSYVVNVEMSEPIYRALHTYVVR